MTAQLLRLRLSPKLQAHIKALELRRRLKAEFSKLPYDLPLGDGDKVLGKCHTTSI